MLFAVQWLFGWNIMETVTNVWTLRDVNDPKVHTQGSPTLFSPTRSLYLYCLG